jgi:hypothetical protein
MVVRDLDVMGIAAFPAKADAPLIVHPNAVLAGTISRQAFQAVPRTHRKLLLLDAAEFLADAARANGSSFRLDRCRPPVLSTLRERISFGKASEASFSRPRSEL